MKKVLSTVLASCILLSVAACGQPGSSESSTEPQSSTISEETSQTSQPASGETVEFWDIIWGSDADAYEKAVRGICDVVEQEKWRGSENAISSLGQFSTSLYYSGFIRHCA